MILIVEGVLAGAAHVLSGPDHLAGVAPLAVDRRQRIRPALVGASWGLGHGLGVAALGVLGQMLLSVGEVQIAAIWAERLVGLVLIGIGIVAIRRARGLVAQQHRHCHAAFGVGVVHGLAGAGHFWAVIPSLAMSHVDAAVYIGSYLAATVAVMTLFGASLGRFIAAFGERALPRFMIVVGGTSIAIGVAWLWANLAS